MIQFADKVYKNYLTPKEQRCLDIYYHSGEKDINKAIRSAGYNGQFAIKKSQELLNKPLAIEYLKQLKQTQAPQVDIFTRVNTIASNPELRPEVQLDALSLLSKLEDKYNKIVDIDDKNAIPCTPKDRINWLTEQLKAYKGKAAAGIALAEDINRSVFATTDSVSLEQDKP